MEEEARWLLEPSSGSATTRASGSSRPTTSPRICSPTTQRSSARATARSPRARRSPTRLRPGTRVPRPSTSSRSSNPVPVPSAAGGLPERRPGLVVHRAQVGRDELAVVGLARGGQILPAGDRAAAPRGTAQTHGREVIDREVAHGVVERQLLPGANWLAGDEVEGLPVVETDTAVGVAGVVDLRSQAAMGAPGAGAPPGSLAVGSPPAPRQGARP